MIEICESCFKSLIKPEPNLPTLHKNRGFIEVLVINLFSFDWQIIDPIYYFFVIRDDHRCLNPT